MGDDNWAIGANAKNEVVVLTPREVAEQLALQRAEAEMDQEEERSDGGNGHHS